jgi:hypothetical protein
MPHLKISVISGGRCKQDKLLQAGFDRWVSVLRKPKSPELVVPGSGTSTAQKMRHRTRASSPFDQHLRELAFSNEYPNVILYCGVCPINVDSLQGNQMLTYFQCQHTT